VSSTAARVLDLEFEFKQIGLQIAKRRIILNKIHAYMFDSVIVR